MSRTKIFGQQIHAAKVESVNLKNGAVTDDKLSRTGIAAGSYTKLSVSETGRVVGGENPTTLEGMGITDAAKNTASYITVSSDASLPNERTLTGTSSQVSVTDNGAGSTVAISLVPNTVIPGVQGVTIPSGTSEDRSLNPQAGQLRYNTTTGHLEIFSDNWKFFKDSEAMLDEKEPTGHLDRTQSVVSFNETTRTFTIAPAAGSFVYYINGNKYTITSPLSVVIDDITGPKYVMLDSNKQLVILTSPQFNDYAYSGYIYWDAVSKKATVLAEERHGLVMDGATHAYLHSALGTQYISGLNIGNVTTGGNGSSNSHLTFSITNGLLFDEDIRIAITHSNTPGSIFEQVLTPIAQVPTIYKLGTEGIWTKSPASNYPIKIVNDRLGYNKNTNGEWSLSQVTDGYYSCVWIFSTNDIRHPVVSFIGQCESASLNDAKAVNSLASFDFTGFPSTEFKSLYRLIYHTSSAYTNIAKSALVDVEDVRAVKVSAVASSSGTDHSSLSNLSADDHQHYVHTNVHRTISAVHTFNPPDVGAPFSLGARALGQKVVGLNADLLDGLSSESFQPANSDLSAIANISTNGIVVRNGANSWSTRELVAGNGISITSGTGDNNPSISNAGVLSAFGRTGAVQAAKGDYALPQLADVLLSSPSPGDLLSFDGNNWINKLVDPSVVVQVVTGSFPNISFNSIIPFDNTPPTSTEGSLVFSTQFTPKRADSAIIVFASSFFTVNSSANVWVSGAFFSDNILFESNLLGTTTDIGFGTNFTLFGGIMSGTTATKTISFRMGPNTNVTVHVGQGISGQAFGGNNVNSHYIIMEVLL